MKIENKILMISIGFSIIIILISYFLISDQLIVMIYTTIIAMAISVIPYFFYSYNKIRILGEKEEFFPMFLRDLAESKDQG